MAHKEIIDVDPKYKEGFELGYLLQRGDRPELQGIMQRATEAQYKAGLSAGQTEAEREVLLARLQNQRTATDGLKPKGPRPR